MPSNRLKAFVLGAIALLIVIVAGLGIVFVTMRQAPKPAAGNAVTIEVSDTACTPNVTSVGAGAPTFSIKNTSNRAIEWEILNGVMVLAERENIAPGFAVELTPRLDPGSYQMTCGLLSNPRGTLTVTAADGSTTALPAAPKLADLVAPTAEYRVYAIQTADQLTKATAALAAAVKAGDLTAARTNIADAEAAFARIGPILHLFDHDAAPLSSGPTGLSTLGKSLVGATTTDGIAFAAASTAAAAATFGGAVHTTTAAPHEIIIGAGAVVAGLAKGYDAPATAAAGVAGVRKVVELFRPLTLRADKSLSAKLDADLASVEAELAKSPATSTPQLADLSADLTDLLSALGLNAS